MSSSVFSPFNERYAHPLTPIFFSFSIDDVKQALQYLFCDLIKSMTTKSVSLMAMTSSAGYTWMASSALVSRAPLHCSRLKQFTRKLLLSFKMLLTPFGSGSFLSDVGWMQNLTSQDGSPIFVPCHAHEKFSFTYGYKCTQSQLSFNMLGMWPFGDILKCLPSRCYPPPPIYFLSSETSREASGWVQFRTERSFMPLGLHGCEFLEPGR